MWDHMQGYGGMGLGGLFGLLIWLLLIIGLAWAVIWILSSSRSRGKGLSALEILKRRYASGEISEEQYLKMKHEIENRG